MSDFTVLRSLDGYCLVLDKKRIAGGKPDYRGDNVLVDWTTEVVYGPVDDLAVENAKLRELVRDVNKAAHMLCEAWEGSCSKEAEGMSLHAVCPISDTNELCVFGKLYDRMRELGVEV